MLRQKEKALRVECNEIHNEGLGRMLRDDYYYAYEGIHAYILCN